MNVENNFHWNNLQWLVSAIFHFSFFFKIKIKLYYSQTLTFQKKKLIYLLQWKPFKNNQKCFLFHLKSSPRFQDIYIFVLTFWPCRKNGLIRKMTLLWRHSLVNKQLKYTYYGQAIQQNKNILLQNSCRKWSRETSSRPFVFQKGFTWGKSKWSAA